MGWSYNPWAEIPHNDKEAKIKEVEKQFGAHLCVLKSTMLGSTYYAAVYNEDEPDEVFAVEVLTHNSAKMGFGTKIMDEFAGPYPRKCPASILKLLTPLNKMSNISEQGLQWAQDWRNECAEYNKTKNKKTNLPIGTIIEFIDWDGEPLQVRKMPPAYQFKTTWWQVKGGTNYVKKKDIPDEFTIIYMPDKK
jgi:hypothetical protein